jgi:hypothetical protein
MNEALKILRVRILNLHCWTRQDANVRTGDTPSREAIVRIRAWVGILEFGREWLRIMVHDR